VAVLAYVLIRWLLGGSAVPGFAFLASIVAIFSGAQLLALGIIGEYLANAFPHDGAAAVCGAAAYRLVIRLVTHSTERFPDCAGDFL